MEAIWSSETSVDFQQCTRCYVAEDRNVHKQLCENFTTYTILEFMWTVMELNPYPQADSHSASQEIPSILWNQPPVVCILSRTNQLKFITSHFCKIHFNVISIFVQAFLVVCFLHVFPPIPRTHLIPQACRLSHVNSFLLIWQIYCRQTDERIFAASRCESARSVKEETLCALSKCPSRFDAIWVPARAHLSVLSPGRAERVARSCIRNTLVEPVCCSGESADRVIQVREARRSKVAVPGYLLRPAICFLAGVCFTNALCLAT
jgi:hypothetical protein